MMRPLRIAAHAEREVERQRAARDDLRPRRRLLRAEAHDRALAVCLLDRRDCQVECFAAIVIRHRYLPCPSNYCSVAACLLLP